MSVGSLLLSSYSYVYGFDKSVCETVNTPLESSTSVLPASSVYSAITYQSFHPTVFSFQRLNDTAILAPSRHCVTLFS
ncbi:hypothetical protein [Synechococcus sp. M16CYN]|uniref:hypothetical protein n=1 Tax=Synechococcus sp. M16CYN TaxID=3103139 RepID=UPI00333F6EC6